MKEKLEMLMYIHLTNNLYQKDLDLNMILQLTL